MPRALRLQTIGNQVKRSAVTGLNQGARIVARRAKTHAPVKSGRLKSEITAVPATGDGSTYTASVISPTPYALQQEFTGGVTPTGGSYPPQPYLRPALHESQADVTNAIRNAVRSAINGKEVEEKVEI